ncbi:reverse transcriptase domain-containing protein [Oceanobacillus sp. FSL K6-0118]|uniref:reverse transcriptase domain-containing protein n=1 Tax=Oceanobacillus sp. FSL K6-0118 TaxID=2921418 RepID=UPI004046A38E
MANKYRYNDYYEMTQVFDDLYQKSKNNFSFRNLMNTITSENNIRLAFRMIKTNTGSQTAGVDNITIKDIKDKDLDSYIKMVQANLSNYKPDTVKRVYIPKADGKKRPLGIPTMVDRLVQQSIRQVLEPICEAKFHPHSYGFRPNRSTKHAISRMMSLINIGKMYYTVDIDIKGFFDNVNHTKLVKQMYALGIRDRKLLA